MYLEGVLEVLPAKVIPKRLSVCSTRVLEVIRGRPSDGGMHLDMTLLSRVGISAATNSTGGSINARTQKLIVLGRPRERGREGEDKKRLVLS